MACPDCFLVNEKSKQIRNCRVNNEVPPPSSQAYIQKEHLWSIAGCIFLLQSYITSLCVPVCIYIYIFKANTITHFACILLQPCSFFLFNHRSKSSFSVRMLSCFYLPWLSPSPGRVYTFVWKCIFTSLRYILSSGIAGRMVTQWLTFWGIAKCLPCGCPTLQSHQQCVKAPVTPHPSDADHCRLPDHCRSSPGDDLIVALIFIFLMVRGVKYVFKAVLGL